MVPTAKPPATYLIIVEKQKKPINIITNLQVYYQNDAITILSILISTTKQAHTSEHGGQSPSQQRRLHGCLPQSRNVWHFLSHVKS